MKIKRIFFSIIFITLLLYIFIVDSSGQVRSYGLKIGTVASRLDFDYTTDINLNTYYRWGANIGFYIEVLDVSNLSVVGSVDYTQKGVGFKLIETTPEHPEGTGEKMSFANELDYLSLSILLKPRIDVQFGEFYLLAGPRLDVLLRVLNEYSVYTHFRDGAYGVTIGGGFMVRDVVARGVGLEIQYSPNFGKEYTSDKLNIKETSVQILLLIEL